MSCPSSFTLLAALAVAKPAVAEMLGRDGILAAVLVDDAAAHFYTDKAARGPREGAGVGAGVRDLGREGAPLTLMRVHSAMAAGLKRLQTAYRVPIVATKHLLGGGECAVCVSVVL